MRLIQPLYLKPRFFYALGLIALLFALGFGWNVLVLVATTGIGILVCAIMYDVLQTRKFANHVEAHREAPKHFSMFDENDIKLKFTNSFNQSISVEIIDEIPAQFQYRDFSLKDTLPANQNKTIQYAIVPKERGEFWFNNLNLFFSGPLGLVSYRKEIPQQKLIKVYPSFVQMKKFELLAFNANRQQEGIRKIRKIGHGYEFGDIRQYVSGDDPRSVNWKASSRQGKLMVNNYEDEKSQLVYAVIDTSRSMRMPFEGLSLMDYAINTSLAILNIAHKNQDNTGLLTFAKNTEKFIPAQRRNNQVQIILDSLYNQKGSTQESNFSGLFNTLKLKVKSRSLLLLFTNFLSLNSLQRVLPELKRINRNHLLVVVFFENTELSEFQNEPVEDTLDLASKTMAKKLSEELNTIVYELRNAGIQTIKSRPEELTSNTVSKYLELKSRGLI